MSDALAASLGSDAPATDSPSSVPDAPATPAAEPSRLDTIREAVEAQKERAAGGEGSNPNAPPKAATSPADRARDPSGKFAPATDRPAPDRTAAPAAPAAGAQAATPDAPETPRPPPGWSAASKVAFDNLPDTVKADIAKREQEVNQGFAKLAEFKPVEKYAEMAKRGGTTLDRALEQYTGIENLLRRDVFAGVEQVLKNVGVNPRSFAMAYLQRSSGAPVGAAQPDLAARQPAAIDPQSIVRQATEAVRAEYEARQVQSDVQKFASDPKNRFYENVKPTMAELVRTGLATDLQDAYDKACRLHPDVWAAINAPPQPDPRKLAADQARAAAKATIGAPGAGVTPGKAALPPNTPRRDVIRAAVAAQKGARA